MTNAINMALSVITRLLTLLFWERNPTSWTYGRTVEIPVDSPAEVKVGQAPLELEEVVPGALESPKGDVGSSEHDKVKLSATEVVLRLLEELEAVESPESRKPPRTCREEVVTFKVEATKGQEFKDSYFEKKRWQTVLVLEAIASRDTGGKLAKTDFRQFGVRP